MISLRRSLWRSFRSVDSEGLSLFVQFVVTFPSVGSVDAVRNGETSQATSLFLKAVPASSRGPNHPRSRTRTRPSRKARHLLQQRTSTPLLHPNPTFHPRFLLHVPQAHPIPSIHLSIALPPFKKMSLLPPQDDTHRGPRPVPHSLSLYHRRTCRSRISLPSLREVDRNRLMHRTSCSRGG
jgi:hypothetical protein